MALYLGHVTHLKILKELERQEINAHLATVNPGDRQPVQGRFLSFGDDNQAVRGLVNLLGMDDDYANEVLRNGEEMMKREVDKLRHRRGDPSNVLRFEDGRDGVGFCEIAVGRRWWFPHVRIWLLLRSLH